MHARAAPDADRTKLKLPETAAREFADAIGKLLAFINRSSERRLQEAVP
jgi:hypothetical protein